MGGKEERATPPVIPTIPFPPTTPTKVLVRELKREPAKLGERSGSVTWEQPAALQSRQYPFWYRYRAAFGSLIIVNVCIATYVLFTVKPKPKASKKGKIPSLHSASAETEVSGSQEGNRPD